MTRVFYARTTIFIGKFKVPSFFRDNFRNNKTYKNSNSI